MMKHNKHVHDDSELVRIRKKLTVYKYGSSRDRTYSKWSATGIYISVGLDILTVLP